MRLLIQTQWEKTNKQTKLSFKKTLSTNGQIIPLILLQT